MDQDIKCRENVIARLLKELSEKDAIIAHKDAVIATLESTVRHDPLTELYNRRGFSERLNQMIGDQVRNGGTTYVAFVDLDDFKNINETYGHHTGDRMLQVIGRRMKAIVRQSDVVARFAGDEFMLALHFSEENADEEFTKFTARLLDEIKKPFLSGGNKMRVSASIGTAKYGLNKHINAKELIDVADAAMFEIKHNGKDNFTIVPVE